ncbi:MAG: hypothetical protein OQK82_02110 [Candidatus Pacearchaeota archaeon]|nr:hypothetical protein [Candidatus Pacearchaeota archaeon]
MRKSEIEARIKESVKRLQEQRNILARGSPAKQKYNLAITELTNLLLE